MDIPSRVKMKIGEHEIEAEGTPDLVREQFQAWQELVKLAYTSPQVVAVNLAGDAPPTPPDKIDTPPGIDSDLSKILRVDNRIVSLTARLASVHEAVLVMLYGQKVIRNNDSVTGAELIAGLSATGGFSVDRLDRYLNKLAEDGDVMAFGERRGKKYRLTNTGISKARAIAANLVAAVA